MTPGYSKESKPGIEQIDANATHNGLLAMAINKFQGPVLELGVGHYSTPMIHFMCMDRWVVSMDTDPGWLGFFEQHFRTANHQFVCTNGTPPSNSWWMIQEMVRKSWGVVFVDHAPAEDRVKCIRMLRGTAGCFVVHDAEPVSKCYEWGDIFDTFKYKRYYDRYGNGTMIVSDMKEVGEYD